MVHQKLVVSKNSKLEIFLKTQKLRFKEGEKVMLAMNSALVS